MDFESVKSENRLSDKKFRFVFEPYDKRKTLLNCLITEQSNGDGTETELKCVNRSSISDRFVATKMYKRRAIATEVRRMQITPHGDTVETTYRLPTSCQYRPFACRTQGTSLMAVKSHEASQLLLPPATSFSNPPLRLKKSMVGDGLISLASYSAVSSRRLKQSEFLKGTSYASSRRFERNKRNGKEMAKEFAKSEERVRLSVIAVGDTASGGGGRGRGGEGKTVGRILERKRAVPRSS
ncbi:hypothetical protein V1478_000289 [Vespula squamosa]|uniref:Uncharacterized protein n=1 Tax=Vespula squamosa TaxID=30214 RepID=A0ABD2C743_VESSQ